jgi:L-ribulose-5-phosphate 3-epimerase
MYLSYFSDEAHHNLEEALKLGNSLGLKYVELRSIDGVNVLDLTAEDVSRVKGLLAKYSMKVSCLATPFFKCALPGEATLFKGNLHAAKERGYAEHLQLLYKGVKLAQQFETNRLRIFSFWRTEKADFRPLLQTAIELTLEATNGTGILPCLENEGACNIGSSEELAEAADHFKDIPLGFIWDPGNCIWMGTIPSDEAFLTFAPKISLVHLKDAAIHNGKPIGTLIGEGNVDYRKELRRIAKVFDGPLTLEPHWAPDGNLAESMRKSVQSVREIAQTIGLNLT